MLRGYLRSESIAPLPLQRLAAAHPDTVDAVFRKILRRRDFTWAEHGQALMRRRKAWYYQREPRPGVSVIGDRLLELASGGAGKPAGPRRRPSVRVADDLRAFPFAAASTDPFGNRCTPATMEVQIVHSLLLRLRHPASAAALACAAAMAVTAGPGTASAAARLPAPKPTISDFQWLTGSQTPPTEANCFSVGRRCFTPTSMQNSYNVSPLLAAGNDGHGVTVAIIDSFGDPNIASDLNVFDTAMKLPHMCGEPGISCASGTPTFQHEYWDGKTIVKAPPPGSNGTGTQARNAWALETALDVEWVHSIAPQANILNVTTNPAETLGVQGFPQMMDAEQFIVDNHLASVISQSFAAAEETFASTQPLMNLRHAFVSAAAGTVSRCWEALVTAERPTAPSPRSRTRASSRTRRWNGRPRTRW